MSIEATENNGTTVATAQKQSLDAFDASPHYAAGGVAQ